VDSHFRQTAIFVSNTMTKQPINLSQKEKRTTASRSKSFQVLPNSFYPSEDSVICAKGKKAKEHPGNQFLSSLMQSKLEEYRASASKLDRSYIVSQIMKEVTDRGGLFVRQLTVGGQWFDVGPRNSREKIGQMFRDALHELFRSSTKAKAMIRRKRDLADTDAEEDIMTQAGAQRNSSAASRSIQPAVPQISNRKMKQSTETPSTIRAAAAARTQVLPDITLSFLPAAVISSTATPFGVFSMVDSVPETSRLDFEPLPLNHALIEVDFDSMSSTSSEDSGSSQSFEDAMDEMYKYHFVAPPATGTNSMLPILTLNHGYCLNVNININRMPSKSNPLGGFTPPRLV
jgi:hypothetical protein